MVVQGPLTHLRPYMQWQQQQLPGSSTSRKRWHAQRQCANNSSKVQVLVVFSEQLIAWLLMLLWQRAVLMAQCPYMQWHAKR